MKFIFNFIFFGLLFYAIWIFFPETFQTLVSWIAKIYDFFRDLFLRLTEQLSSHRSTEPTAPAGTTGPVQVAFLPLLVVARNLFSKWF